MGIDDRGEDALWDAARAGDDRAFVALFRAHRDHVFRYALRLVETTGDADDVSAAAFLELWRRRGAVRLVDGSVLPWLLVTAGNAARNVTRGTRRWRALLDRLPRGDVGDDPAELALERLETGRRDDLRAALARLRSVDRTLLALTAIDGMPVARAAEAVGLTPVAARSRLSRAKARVRRDLGRDLGHGEDLASVREGERGEANR